MEIDKDFVYQVITELRTSGKDKSTDDRILMLGTANVMEQLFRKHMDNIEIVKDVLDNDIWDVSLEAQVGKIKLYGVQKLSKAVD